MSKLTLRNLIGLFAVCVFLSACAAQSGCGRAQTPEVTTPDTTDVPQEPVTPVEVPVKPSPQPSLVTGDDGTKILIGKHGDQVDATVHFALDDSNISRSDFAVLQEHADFLVKNRDQSVSVEGHCDERGTRDYNLALGQRRANAVQDFFLGNGVRQNQIKTKSFGEEQPIDTASNETAWAKNRRVELVYE